MNDFDLAVLAFIGISGLFGFLRGTLREALTLVHVLAAAALALAFTDEARSLVEKLSLLPSDERRDLIPWTAAFLLLYVFGLGILTLVRPFLRPLRFPGDRIPGLVLGLARGAALVLCLLPLVLWIAPRSGSTGDKIASSRALPAADRASATGAGRLLVPSTYSSFIRGRIQGPGQ